MLTMLNGVFPSDFFGVHSWLTYTYRMAVCDVVRESECAVENGSMCVYAGPVSWRCFIVTHVRFVLRRDYTTLRALGSVPPLHTSQF